MEITAALLEGLRRSEPDGSPSRRRRRLPRRELIPIGPARRATLPTAQEIVTVTQTSPHPKQSRPAGRHHNPLIDELLRPFASTRWSSSPPSGARQINDYYQQIDEGMLEYVGPLVTPGIAEKSLSIALREINAACSSTLRVGGGRHGGSARVVGVAGGRRLGVPSARAFTERGHSVRWPTPSALNFVGAATFEALSATGVDDRFDVAESGTSGSAMKPTWSSSPGDRRLLSVRRMAARMHSSPRRCSSPPALWFAPAMHTEMWNHPATRDNVATLRRHGAIVDPAHGRLTGVDTGPGRFRSRADREAHFWPSKTRGSPATRGASGRHGRRHPRGH